MNIKVFSAALLASSVATAATPVDGWYTSVFVGYNYLEDNISTYTYNGYYLHNAGYNGGYDVGGRVGFQSNPLRYELEYTYLYANTKHFAANYIRQTSVTGDLAGSLFMANAYYDFPDMLPAISPFLGVGIGYAYLQGTLSSLGPILPIYFRANDSAFAYQGTAGITYNFAENYAFNLSYRYVATNRIDNFGRMFQTQMANAGVVYHFDRGNYK